MHANLVAIDVETVEK